MAIIHRATLKPSKLELVTPWLRGQSWAWLADGVTPQLVASYRLDDPAGEVGVEVLLLSVPAASGDGAGTTLLQVPLTYRGAPLDGADSALIGTMDHPVLGKRWAYDAAHDPVFVAEAVRTIVGSGESAKFLVEGEGGAQTEKTEGVAQAYGTGAPAGTPPELRGIPSTPVSLPVVQEVEDTAVASLGDYRLAVLRHPATASASALDAPAGQLRVRLPQGGAVGSAGSVLAARLLD